MVFVLWFVVTVKTSPAGPTTTEDQDDLGVRAAYVDPGLHTMVLVAGPGWTRLSLDRVLEANRRNVKPVRGNSFRYGALINGDPPAEEVNGMEKVAVRTNQYANFGYDHYPPDGRARMNAEDIAPIPDGYTTALYRGEAVYRANNRQQLKSYVLVTPRPQPDGHCGFQFFYDPDDSYSFSFQFPDEHVLDLPSFLALCVAVPLAFSAVGRGETIALFFLAFALHGISLLGYQAVEGFKRSFGNYDSGQRSDFIFLSTVALVVLVGIKLSRDAKNDGRKGT